MGNSAKTGSEQEIERLREALAGETQRRLDVERQLDRAAEDFEKFVSTTAHNLRESLRDVASYSQLMAENYAGRLDPEADVFLDRIRDGAARMHSLLAGVVDYWAACPGERPSYQTDMEAVLNQALLTTDKQIAERNAVVSHDPLPMVTGDFDLLTKVLQHLIRNAIEYCAAPGPRIHISSRREDLDWVFSVRDNGPGVDPAFQGRIFRVFTRLHGKEYPGNGLGLAFCKKAIEWHGGRIWMEAALGTGCTFYFALPAAG